MKRRIAFFLCFILTFLCACSRESTDSDSVMVEDYDLKLAISMEERLHANRETAEGLKIYDMPIFRSEEIPEWFEMLMKDTTWDETAPVEIGDLRLVYVTYIDFDNESRVGALVVHEAVAVEILEIFESLYNVGFQIEKIIPIEYYGGDDDLSMADNNTSAFNFRPMTHGSNVSKHGYGLAVDINPVQNPYSRGEIILPQEGEAYLDREVYRNGMIRKGDACYNSFVERGWTWGGDWRSLKDYQHFEKTLP